VRYFGVAAISVPPLRVIDAASCWRSAPNKHRGCSVASFADQGFDPGTVAGAPPTGPLLSVVGAVAGPVAGPPMPPKIPP
jgi:hypothetical protein